MGNLLFTNKEVGLKRLDHPNVPENVKMKIIALCSDGLCNPSAWADRDSISDEELITVLNYIVRRHTSPEEWKRIGMQRVITCASIPIKLKQQILLLHSKGQCDPSTWADSSFVTDEQLLTIISNLGSSLGSTTESRSLEPSTKRQRLTDESNADYFNYWKVLLDDNYSQYSGNIVGPSFFTTQELQEGHQHNETQAQLVAYLTPLLHHKLMPLFPSHCVLANCEHYNNWIPFEVIQGCTSPSLFICSHYLVNFKPSYTNAPPHAPNYKANYGELKSINTLDSMMLLLTIATNLTDKSVCEMLHLMMQLSQECSASELKGMIFDLETCQLITASNGEISQLISVTWNQQGTQQLVMQFCQDIGSKNQDWHDALEVATNAIGVQIPTNSTASVNASNYSSVVCVAGAGAALLGAGEYGRVFKAIHQQDNDQTIVVMKIAIGEKCLMLEREYGIISMLSDEALQYVVGVSHGSLWCGSLSNSTRVSAYLMDIRGIPFQHYSEITNNDGRAILISLSGLHYARVAHNDARYQNVVKHIPTQRYLWIDLMDLGPPSESKFVMDVTMFLTSVRRKCSSDLIKDYAKRAFNRSFVNDAERVKCIKNIWNMPVIKCTYIY